MTISHKKKSVVYFLEIRKEQNKKSVSFVFRLNVNLFDVHYVRFKLNERLMLFGFLRGFRFLLNIFYFHFMC